MRGRRSDARPQRAKGTRSQSAVANAGGDHAVVPVIEAILIGLIIAGALIFSVSFQSTPPATTNPGAADLEASLWGAVETLDRMHYPDSSYGNSSLSKAVAETLSGDSTNLTAAMDTYLPPGAAYNLYLNNGHDRLTVYESREPTGQTVGVSYPFEPRWSTVFAKPDLDWYSALTMEDIEPASDQTILAIGTTAIPIYHSNLVWDQGVPMKVSMDGSQGYAFYLGRQLQGDLQVDIDQDAWTTLLHSAEEDSQPSASIYMNCDNSTSAPIETNPCYAVDLSGDITDVPTYQPRPDGYVPFIIHNDGPADLPAGTLFTINVPVGLEVTDTRDDAGNFTFLRRSGASTAPQRVIASLDQPLAADGEAGLDLKFDAYDDDRAFGQITAKLSNGAVSESQLLVKITDKATGVVTGADGRVLLVSGPKPAGAPDGSTDPTGRWGIVVSAPIGTMNVERLEVDLPFGEEIITEAAYPDDWTPPPEADTSTPGHNKTHIWWNASGSGEGEVEGWGFHEIQLQIDTDGSSMDGSTRFPNAHPGYIFEDYRPSGVFYQDNLGVWWNEFPPADSGTDNEVHQGYPVEDSTFESRLGYRNKVLSGDGSYNVTSVVDIDEMVSVRDSVRAAEVFPGELKATLGETVPITVDAEDLASVLSGTSPVNDLRVATSIYQPWGHISKTPDKTIVHAASAGASHFPIDMEVEDIDDDGDDDIFVSYSDGNVYGLRADDLSAVPGGTYSLGTTATSDYPTLLAKGHDTAGDPFYTVGSTTSTANVFGVQHQPVITELWSRDKSSEDVRTLALNASADLDGDGHDDAIHRQPQAAGADSDLLLRYGNNGTLFPGAWSTTSGSGVTITGQGDQVGMGTLGPDAEQGIYSNTDGNIGAAIGHYINDSWEPSEGIDLDDPTNPELTSPVSTSITISTSASGMKGFYNDGSEAWNYSGGAFQRLMNAGRIPTGGAWTGILGGGSEGFLSGLTAETPVNPADGWINPIAEARNGMDMANDLEGYAVREDGYIDITRNAWSQWRTEGDDIYRPLHDIATLDAAYGTDGTKVFYAVGANGVILKSTDAGHTIEDISGTGAVVAELTASLTDPDPDLSLDPLSTLDLSTVTFRGVHAVSEDEAYFVGQGTGTTDGNAYIVHTTDGGETLMTTEIACEESGTPIVSCGFYDIETNGTAMWAVGYPGLAMAQNTTGDVQNVSLPADQPSPRVTPDAEGAYITYNLTANPETELQTIQVMWSNKTFLNYYESIKLDPGTGNDTLWSLSVDSLGTRVDGDFDANQGAGRGAVIDLRGYDDDKNLLIPGGPDENHWSGTGTFAIGPWHDDDSGSGSTVSKADFPNVNLTLLMTYGDGSQEIVTLGVGDGMAQDAESPGMSWRAVDAGGYTTPDCFGAPDVDCATLHSINFTTNQTSGDLLGVASGEKQGPLDPKRQTVIYRLPEGSTEWKAQKNIYADVTLYDAAITPADIDRWVAVGNQSRAFVSFNKGVNWTELPWMDIDDREDNDLYSLDLTHPEVGYLVGGGALSMTTATTGGYTEFGQLISDDLYTADATDIYGVELNASGLEVFVDGFANGGSVTIEVQDGDGSWETLLGTDTTDGLHVVAFDTPTREIKLRVNLSSPAPFNRVSPTMVGSFKVNMSDASSLVDTATVDLSQTSQWASGTKTVDLDPDRSMIRLVPAKVPWVQKIGNLTSPDRGARVGDMDISPNGWTAWVGTEGIYDVSAQYQSVELFDDDSLYAFNLTDGRPESWWTPVSFDAPITHVRAYQDGVFVTTEGTGSLAKVYHVALDGTTSSTQLESGEQVADIAIVDVGSNGIEDLIVATRDPSTGSGRIVQIENTGSGIFTGPAKQPNMKGFYSFAYTVPKNGTYGAYIIETDFDWTITDGGSSVTQTARFMNAFTVAPPNGKLALSPTYNLEIIAWMEDWG